MATVLSGLIGGLLATIVMTMFMMTLGDDSPPPTAVLWGKYVGGPPENYVKQGMLLHVLYGVGAGVAFVLVAAWLGFGLDDLLFAVGAGVVFGLALTVFGMVFWMKIVLGMDGDPKTMATFTFFHVVYGLVLGAVVGSGFLA